MTDLDNTQIITDDESLLQNSSTIDTVREKNCLENSHQSLFIFYRKLH